LQLQWCGVGSGSNTKDATKWNFTQEISKKEEIKWDTEISVSSPKCVLFEGSDVQKF
jgi:hypothetical protein